MLEKVQGEFVEVTPAVGDRVAYEDMANPWQEGTVVELVGPGAYPAEADFQAMIKATRVAVGDFRVKAWEATRAAGMQYLVVFDAVESKFGEEYGLPARKTISDCRQCGWMLVARAGVTV